MLHRTYMPAKMVENILEELLLHEDDLRVYSNPYANGRERGFAFDVSGETYGTVFVAEARNSDLILVFFCPTAVGAEWSSVTEAQWSDPKLRKYFKYNQPFKAAEQVLKFLKNKERYTRKAA